MSVIVAGHLCVDLTPGFTGAPAVSPGHLSEVGPLDARLGGCVANTARVLSAHGVQARVSASLGDDALATLARELLREEALSDAGVGRTPAATTSYSIVVEAPGHDRAFWHHTGSNDVYDADMLVLGEADILHLGYPSLLATMRTGGGAGIRRLFERAKAAGITTSLDLAVVDPDSPTADEDWGTLLGNILPLTDVISPSLDDVRSIAPRVSRAWATMAPADVARDLVRRGAKVAMVTAGAAGLFLAVADAVHLRAGGRAVSRLTDWGGAVEHARPVVPARFVSANGAGDAATAGLLAAMLSESTPPAALSTAATAAASAIAGGFAPRRSSRIGGRV